MNCVSIVPGCNTETEEQEIHRLMDEFLDVYSLYLSTRLKFVKEETLMKAFEIHMLDPTFNCAI